VAQQVEETLLRHRRSDQDALAEVAAHHDQRLHVGGGFDAFGDAALPKRCARSIRGLQIAAVVASVAQFLTKLESS